MDKDKSLDEILNLLEASLELQEKYLDTIYPLTIISARYGGTYEHGMFCAFHCYPQALPEDAMGDDTACSDWWLRNRDRCGIGVTPNAAQVSLHWKMKENPEFYTMFDTNWVSDLDVEYDEDS